jgi:hypothetical protein
MQKEGLAKPYTLEEWSEEAVPALFDDTVEGAKKAISEANHKCPTSEIGRFAAFA